MRKDEQGNVVTLEEDIKRIWSAHGMEVLAEEVRDLKSIDPSLEGYNNWRSCDDCAHVRRIRQSQ